MLVVSQALVAYRMNEPFLIKARKHINIRIVKLELIISTVSKLVREYKVLGMCCKLLSKILSNTLSIQTNLIGIHDPTPHKQKHLIKVY